jgi:hypothetical protein
MAAKKVQLKKVQIAATIDSDLYTWITDICKRRRITRPEFVRETLEFRRDQVARAVQP